MDVLVRYQDGAWYVLRSFRIKSDHRFERKGASVEAARKLIQGKGGHVVVMTLGGALDQVIRVPRHRALTGAKRK